MFPAEPMQTTAIPRFGGFFFVEATQGNIRYRLKTPYRDGTTDLVLEPLDKVAGPVGPRLTLLRPFLRRDARLA